MHIEKVSYQRTFNLGNFNSERIGIDFILHQGESETQALDNAKKIVEETHKRYHPNLEPLKHEIEAPITKEAITASNVAEINNCESKEELLKCKILSKVGKSEFEAYHNKFKQLQDA